MKRHLSVLAVSARATVNKVLLLLGVMAAAEAALFCALRSGWTENGSFDLAVTQSGTAIVCIVCFVALCALLLLTNVLGSKTLYTTSRLRVSKEVFVLWQGAYNTACFLAFWAVQALLVAAFSYLYARWSVLPDSASEGPQAVLLATYNNSFLHAVLPLSDLLCTVRNLILALTLGFALSGGTQSLRRGGTPVIAVLPVALAAVFFHVNAGETNVCILVSGGMLLLCAAAVANGIGEEADDE